MTRIPKKRLNPAKVKVIEDHKYELMMERTKSNVFLFIMGWIFLSTFAMLVFIVFVPSVNEKFKEIVTFAIFLIVFLSGIKFMAAMRLVKLFTSGKFLEERHTIVHLENQHNLLSFLILYIVFLIPIISNDVQGLILQKVNTNMSSFVTYMTPLVITSGVSLIIEKASRRIFNIYNSPKSNKSGRGK